MFYDTYSLISPSSFNITTEYYINSASNISFANGNIVCSKEICIITCDYIGGCDLTTINASLSSKLILKCLERESCYSINLINGPSNNAEIYCLNDMACRIGTFNLISTINVTIECNYLNCNSTCVIGKSACRDAIFDMHSSINVAVQCSSETDTRDCYRTTFNVSNVYIAVFNIPNARYTAQSMVIIGTNIKSNLTVNCIHDYACYDSYIYCPTNVDAVCNVVCLDSYSCIYLDVYISGVTAPNLNLQCIGFNGCDDTTFICEDTGEMTTYKYSENSVGYICINPSCCIYDIINPDYYIVCDTDSDCNIDCSGGVRTCLYKTIIVGTQANSLTVNCDSSYECQYLQILCPNNGDCIVNCMGTYSCEYIHILNDINTTNYQIKSLSILCSPSYSCQYMSIDEIRITDYMVLTCLEVHSCRFARFTNILIGNYMNVICDALYACYYGKWNIKGISNETQYINIYSKGTRAFYVSVIDIRNFNIINISSIQGYDATRYSDWYLEANDIIFNCIEDTSCTDLDIYANVSNSLSITSSNASLSNFINGDLTVFCSECLNIFYCDQNITIYCGLNTGLYQTMSNSQCQSCICGVDSFKTKDTIAFDDGIWNECPTNEPTISPTYNPTINPTSNPTVNPTTEPTIQPTTIYTIDPSSQPTQIPTSKNEEVKESTLTSISIIITESEDTKENKDGFEEFLYIIIISACFVAFIIVLFCLIFIKQYRKMKRQTTENDFADNSIAITTVQMPSNTNNANPVIKHLPIADGKNRSDGKSFVVRGISETPGHNQKEQIIANNNSGVPVTKQLSQQLSIPWSRKNRNNNKSFVVHGTSVYQTPGNLNDNDLNGNGENYKGDI